jgi:dihydrofolate synthase/folylpolyglutamate synthase
MYSNATATTTATAIATGTNTLRVPTAAAADASAGVRVVLDVCHNPAAFEKLFARLIRDYPNYKITALIGLSRDKDAVTAINSILPFVNRIHLLTADSPRAYPAPELHTALFSDTGTGTAASAATAKLSTIVVPPIDNGRISSTVEHVLRTHSHEPRHLILCCGSFFIMREVRAALGIREPTDPVDMNEHFWKSRTHYAQQHPNATPQ